MQISFTMVWTNFV